jgi:hypothetical protein
LHAAKIAALFEVSGLKIEVKVKVEVEVEVMVNFSRTNVFTDSRPYLP